MSVPTLQELMSEMAALRADLSGLKEQTKSLSQAVRPEKSAITSTRRKTLKRLGLAFLGGVATVGAIETTPVAQAKVIVHPQNRGLVNKVGMLVLPPGSQEPTGNGPGGTFGLIASGNTAPLNLNTLPGGNIGVYSYNSDNYGIYGDSPHGYAVYGISTDNTGVKGVSTNAYGVYGSSNNYIGVRGASLVSYGVYGNSTSSLGVYGFSQTGTGVYGETLSGYAGYFVGNVEVTGTINKGAVGFKIDHPLDPANQYLYHSGIESPDMKNIYDGIVTLNDQGEVTVEMPELFEALNSDYRYQITSLDTASPDLHISQRLQNKKFKIAGGLSGQEVSWQITGIRKDAYAKAYRMPVEKDKNEKERGLYLHPELFGQPQEKSVNFIKPN